MPIALTDCIPMKQRLRPLGFLWLIFHGLFIAATAAAATLPASLDFAFQISRLDTSLNDGQQAVSSTVKQIGITSFDMNQPTLQPGLEVGYAYISSINQPLTAGMELQGFYIAPALRGVLIDGQRLSATLTGTYLYQRVKDNNAHQAVTLEWQQPQVDLDVKCRISRKITLLLGGHYGRIDVDEKISGDISQSLTLKTGPTPGYSAGLEFDLGGDGQVGILLRRAMGDGAEMYFQRQF